GLRDKVLGLVGFGSIGRETASRAQAFGMNILATDIRMAEKAASISLIFA
ncbi:MAG: phosphoglycerate dehydrogenase, partial [Magnetovibrio sp.]|nr:phosphoglycerate dehydrogenase [Magnetovibrio sp.]